jgi:hypothetical protein
MKGSSEAFQPTDTAGKLPYLVLGAKRDDPSLLNDAETRYLFL